MKMKRLLTVFTVISLFLLVTPALATTTATSEITSSNWVRDTDDKTKVTVGYKFGLADNYTLVKLYFVVFPNSLASGQSIGHHIVDVASYNNVTSGTSGLVTGATEFTVYDSNAEVYGVLGGDKVYTFLYIYDTTVASANLLVKSIADVDFFPEDGRYGNSGVTAKDDSISSTDMFMYLALFSGGLIIFLILLNKKGWFSLYSPHGRDTIVYKNGTKRWAERNADGSIKNIVNPKHAMNRDRATPHRYNSGWDRKTSKK